MKWIIQVMYYKKIADTKINGISCELSKYNARCEIDSAYLISNATGFVGASDDGGDCNVNDYGNGSLYCESF